MSETTEAPEGQPPSEPQPTPAPAPTPQPEPSDEPQREADEARDKEDRRIAQLRARLGAAEREREQQRAELEHYRRQAQQYAPAEETPEQALARIEREADARAEAKIAAKRFHEEGRAAYRDWGQRTQDLIDMGADPNMASLLIEMPGGVRVAAALSEDPAELQRITSIQSERGRAIALGRYAASLETGDGGNGHAAPPARQVTRAPAPIRPVTGRVSPQFNEYTANAQTLVDKWMNEDLAVRSKR